jgi:flavin-dependent dehydrogenase
MKIAIIGAGIAGTTCAEELNKLGHKVEIFEMIPKDGSTRPYQIEGAVHFFNNVPELKPSWKMKALEITSKNVKVDLKGNIGYFYEVGGDKGIEAKKRKEIEKIIPINYGVKINNKKELEKEFDIIIASDGFRSKIAYEAKIRSGQPEKMGFGIGFTVEGDFELGWMTILFDNHYAPKGYTYLIPFNEKQASLVSASIEKVIHVKTHRDRLEELAKKQGYEIIDEWVDYESWYNFSTYHKNNLYVIGTAASLTEPAFGFGLKWAIKSAKLCAESIHYKKNYTNLVQKEILSEFEFWKKIRRFFERAEEKEYDQFVNSFNNPIVKMLIERGKYAPIVFKFARWLK